MNEITRILERVDKGDPRAAEQLLPLVYEELRKLAAHRMTWEAPGNTLQPTALVHEAYLRLVGSNQPQEWDGRTHFFAAAAEAMRRILVESARRKQCLKHGGQLERVDVDEGRIGSTARSAALTDSGLRGPTVPASFSSLPSVNQSRFSARRIFFEGFYLPKSHYQ